MMHIRLKQTLLYLTSKALSGTLELQEISKLERIEGVNEHPPEYDELWHLIYHFVVDEDIRKLPDIDLDYRVNLLRELKKIL